MPTPRAGRLALAGLVLLAGALPAETSNCAGTSTGLAALDDLGAGSYQGSQGGLYPLGSNARPAAHDADLLRVGLPIPLDAAGNPDPVNGKIGLISCGMSNATQEFSTFKPRADAYPGKNPAVVIVDCAFPGKTAAIIQDPTDPYWANCDSRISAAGLSTAQVQAVWLKEADANPASGWPAYARTLGDELGAILQVLRTRYPSTRIAYLSSRTYGGYASTALNPEPYAFESGFSVKWLVEAQIAGDARYNFDPARGPVNAPWVAWGPYLWADGLAGRTDGLRWDCADFTPSDGTHPDLPGRAKVADLLLDFFRSDPTAIPWFLACSGSAPGEVEDFKLVKRRYGLELAWASQDPSAGPATDYDVVGGPLDALRLRGDLDAGACLTRDVPDSPHAELRVPVLHLALDEGGGGTAADSSGNGFDGQIAGAAWTAGRLAGALQFDGLGSIVTVPARPALSPTTQLTVALWARPDALTDGVLAAKWISGADQTWMFRVRPDGTLRVNIVPTLTDSTYNHAGGTASPVLAAGGWHHLAFVYDGAQPSDAARLKIYLDGAAQLLTFASGGIPTALTSGLAPVSLGLGADGLRAFSGALDDFRLYDRALTAGEILALAAPARGATWYRIRARNTCAAGSWGDAALDGGAIRCP